MKHLYDPLEHIQARQVTTGMMSTWWGQTRVMKLILERKDESALVLEDDVDFEWDLERLWNTVHRKLPKDDWDITYLGYCWGGENQSELNFEFLARNLSLSRFPEDRLPFVSTM